jgi:hypothetical protein
MSNKIELHEGDRVRLIRTGIVRRHETGLGWLLLSGSQLHGNAFIEDEYLLAGNEHPSYELAVLQYAVAPALRARAGTLWHYESRTGHIGSGCYVRTDEPVSVTASAQFRRFRGAGPAELVYSVYPDSIRKLTPCDCAS